jgi:hypothetical protein
MGKEAERAEDKKEEPRAEHINALAPPDHRLVLKTGAIVARSLSSFSPERLARAKDDEITACKWLQ